MPQNDVPCPEAEEPQRAGWTAAEQRVWRQLSTSPKQSFTQRFRHTPNDIALEEPGIYVVWENETAVYIGIATKTRPGNGSPGRMWGLKDRLGSHQKGRISGSSVAIAAWFCRIAPSLSLEQHEAIAERKLNPSVLTRDYIQQKLRFTCVPHPTPAPIERALHRHLEPVFNQFQRYVRTQANGPGEQAP